MRHGLFLVAVILVANFGFADDDLDESSLIDKIELLGGKVHRDQTRTGCPVIGVDFRGSKRFSEKYIHVLKSFTNLKSLNVNDLVVTNDGLKEIGKLENLTELWLYRTQVTDEGIRELKNSLPQATVYEDVSAESRAIHTIQRLGGSISRNKLLPGCPVVSIDLQRHRRFNQEYVNLIKSFTSLASINLASSEITDAELKEISKLKELKNLTTLNLWNTQITDSGLQELHRLKNLRHLNLGGTQISDEGLKELFKLENLTTLELDYTETSDACIAELKNLKHLVSLDLSFTKTTIAGWEKLKELLPDLTGGLVTSENILDEATAIRKIALLGGRVTRDMQLPGSPVTGIAFHEGRKFTDKYAHLLPSFEHLISLDLSSTDITDDSVKFICELKNLNRLWLYSTPLTQKGIEKLQESLPMTQIFENSSEQINAITTIEKLGGRVTRDIKLPDTPVALIDLQGSKKFNDGNLSLLKSFTRLKTLNLNFSNITDAGLKELQNLNNLTSLTAQATQITGNGLCDLPKLRELDLYNTPITDVGMKKIRRYAELTSLTLTATQITNTGLKEINRLAKLETLYLGSTRVTDEGMTDLGQLRRLTTISLNGTHVSDSGLKELCELHSLEWLDLSGTKITDEGMKEIVTLHSLTTLLLDRTAVTNEGLKQISELGRLKELKLGGTRITDGSLKEIGKLKNLAELGVWDTEITDTSVEELQRALPDLHIVR